MAWNTRKNSITGEPEIVINGFENGIADSPYLGIADIRNANITTSPRQASVGFATVGVTLPPSGYTSVAYTTASGTDVFTTASTSGFYAGMGLTINTISPTAGPTAGNTYYVNTITPTTFKLYSNLSADNLIDITANATGTFSVQTFGTPIDSLSSPSTTFNSLGKNVRDTFVKTSDGLLWYLRPDGANVNSIQFLGNLGHSTAGSPNYGLAVAYNYLFVFQSAKIDYLPLANLFSGIVNPSALWVYGWQDTTISGTGHRAITSFTNGNVYFCNKTDIGIIKQVRGQTFNAATGSTYVYSQQGLPSGLPANDRATCLSQLGQNLLIGGIQNYVYPWDRTSDSYVNPLILAENFTTCIVSMNSSAYIFAGNRGRIYITNGSNIQEFKKFPDALSGTVNPYYNWGWGIYWKDQLVFSLSGTDNAGTTISNFAGLWSIDIEDTKALRLSNSLSYGTYAGTVPTLANMGGINPTGDGVYAFWSNGTGGVDYTSSSPYTNYECRIDTDIIPVGTFLTKNTFSNIEFKLAKPLVSGETVRISQRSNLTSSFVDVPVTEGGGTGDLSGVCTPVNFENVQWIQFRIEMSSTASSPSYVPLTEIILRK